jgi:hypothetical protein
MSHRRRRVFVETSTGRVSASFTVPESADAADVSMALRRRGWSPYRLRLEVEQCLGRHCHRLEESGLTLVSRSPHPAAPHAAPMM